MVLPVSRPTIRPPISPGPAVAATPARSPKPSAGLAHRLGDQQVELLDMGAGCYLRHHAAIGSVLGELGEQRCRQDAAVGADQRRRGLVAAGLDPQHDVVVPQSSLQAASADV